MVRFQSQRGWARWTGLAAITFALVLGGLHAWTAAAQYSMNADGISYLDIGDAYWRGDWQQAINPVWSPMYSWILGLAMMVFKPSISWEFPLVQWVNFAIYIAALASFSFFWHQAWLVRRRVLGMDASKEGISLPEWAFQASGYLVFTWAALSLIEVWAVTPDMLMAALVMLAGGVLLRLRLEPRGWPTWGLFGLLLGLGYLSKTIMLPVGLFFLVASLLSSGGLRAVLPRVAMAALVFALVSVPYILLISQAKGSFAIGESGRVTYMRYINGVPYPHWQGLPPGYGTPLHPSRLVFEDPPVYEFGEPIGGTYPISYNPAYWYEGVETRFNLSQTTKAILANGLVYFNLFFQNLGLTLASLGLLYWVGERTKGRLWERLGNWTLALPALAALLLYGLVYVEGRYLAVFVIFILAELLINIRLENSRLYRDLAKAAGVIIVLNLLGNLGAQNLEGLARLELTGVEPQEVSAGYPPPTWPGETANELAALGVPPGSNVGVIGYGFDSFWARLARVKIAAEMFEWQADPFYLGDAQFQATVINVFRKANVKAIVAEHVPGYARLDGWHQVGQSNYFIYLLESP